MRSWLFLTLLAPVVAACASDGTAFSDEESTRTEAREEADPQIRVVYRQYYGGSHALILENLAGRDLVALRSEPLPPGQPPIAYCPDRIMRQLLKLLKKYDYHEYARPRPPNPRKYGVAELTIIDEDRRMVTLLRRRQPPGKATERYKNESIAYGRCIDAFLQTWNAYRPTMQTSTTGDFGVDRVKK